MTRTRLLLTTLLVILVAAACVPSQPTTPVVTPPTEPSSASPSVPSEQSPVPATSTPDFTWIELSSASGAPESPIQINGYLPGGPIQADAGLDPRFNLVNVCWNGCRNGFRLEDQPLEWSATDPGQFTLTVPALSVPWLGPDGPVSLKEGDYILGLQCLDPKLEETCFQNEAEISAAFRLEGPVPALCQAGQPCDTLTFTPAQAAPGTTIQVSGWAPLVQVYGDLVAGYSLMMLSPGNANAPQATKTDGSYEVVLPSGADMVGQVQQNLDGTITGSFQVPLQLPALGTLQPGVYQLALQAYLLQGAQVSSPVYLALTDFTVESANAWTGTNLGQPLWVQPSADFNNRIVSVDPVDPQRLAYCAPGEIRLSPDGGASWTTIPTTPVAAAAEALGYPVFQGDQSQTLACFSVVFDSQHPASYFAIFTAAKKDYGAPPVFYMAYYTADNGATWQLVPAPSPKTAETFGGFWTDGTGIVQALYSDPAAPTQAPTSILVQATSDGGVTWSPASLTCPPAAPCLRWGTSPGSIGGMGAELPQDVIVSPDGGETWNDPGITVELRTPGPNELVAFSETQAVVLSGPGEYPLRLTQDGGQTWQAIAVPPAPAGFEGSPYYPGLQILPDGSLISQAPNGNGWMLLAQAAQAWCPLATPDLPTTPVLMTPAGDQLWWVSPETQQLQHLPTGNLVCR